MTGVPASSVTHGHPEAGLILGCARTPRMSEETERIGAVTGEEFDWDPLRMARGQGVVELHWTLASKSHAFPLDPVHPWRRLDRVLSR